MMHAYGEFNNIGNYSLLSSLTAHFGDSICKPFRLPESIHEEVEVEPVSSECLPPFDPNDPIIFHDDLGSCYQQVIGYRELFRKKERIVHLKLLMDYYVPQETENESPKLVASFQDELARGGGEGPKGRRNSGGRKNSNSTESKTKTTATRLKGQQSTATRLKGQQSTTTNVAPASPPTSKNRKISDFPVVEPWKDKCEKEQEVPEVKVDFEDAEAVRKERQKAIDKGKVIVRQLSLGSHYMFLYRGKQMDSEWLQLSASTDPEVEFEKDQRKRLMPYHEDWMDPGLNYGSQKFLQSLTFFSTIMSLTFRNPFTFQPCYRNKIVMVHVFRKRMMIFSFSTLFLWLVLCFMVINIVDLKYQTTPTDLYKTMEYNEMALYYIPLMGFIINLFLASFWSLLVLLHYCLVMANYYNLWSKSMPFLDLNPAFGVARYVKNHLICYIIYVLLSSLSFHFRWPLVTRETCGQIFALTFRQMFPRVRLLHPDYFYWGQVGAFIVYMYCVWVNRTLYMFMHTFALILRNACHQWNLNFALRFQLIPTFYRAHLLRVATQTSLLRLYNQHRLIAALCEYFGKTFLQPLFVYGAINIAVITVIMIYFIRYEEEDPATFNYKFTLDLKNLLNSNSKAKIYRTLPKQHEVIAVFFVMLQCIVDFFQGTIGLGWGAAAISGSFEFVRRHGLLQCNTRHERRLIHSLCMSFASVRAPLMTAQRYFGITRRNVFIGMTTMAFFWTMIIQCQVEQPSALIQWVPLNDSACEGLRPYEDVLGGKYCMVGHKYRQKIKRRLQRNRNQLIKKKLNRTIDTKTKYFFFEDCDVEEIKMEDNPALADKDFGMCQMTFSSSKASEKWDSKYPRFISPDTYPQFETRWKSAVSQWKPTQYPTKTMYPCDVTGVITWKEYYRDFFRPCYSRELKQYVVLPVLFLKKGTQARPYNVRDDRKDADCGINPFSQSDIKYLVGCSGRATALDDCGSPRVPDFLINSNKGAGVFRHEPPLRFYTFPVDLPPNYRQAGFPVEGVLRCWDTFTAKLKCADPNLRQYCRMAKSKGKTGLKGYLYGKDCWDFQNFAVFVEPNHYLFCLHPRAEMDTDKVMWIDEKFYNNSMKGRPVPTPATSSSSSSSSGQSGRGIGLKVPPTRKTTTTVRPTLRPEADDIRLRGLKKPKNASTMGRSIGRKTMSLGRAVMQETLTRSATKGRNVMYQEGNKISRKHLFTKFFPCEDNTGKIIGWLPLPRIWWKGTGEKNIKEKDLKDKRGSTACWEDPYPTAIFEPVEKLAKVWDPYGRKFLDDCLTPWWDDDPDIFIPDDVFDPSNVPLVEQKGYRCWEKADALQVCGAQDTKCGHLQ